MHVLQECVVLTQLSIFALDGVVSIEFEENDSVKLIQYSSSSICFFGGLKRLYSFAFNSQSIALKKISNFIWSIHLVVINYINRTIILLIL